MDVAVLTRHQLGQFFAFHGHAPTLAQRAGEFFAALLVANVAGQHIGGCGGFAKVVAQAGEAHFQWRVQACALVEHHFEVNAGVNLGVVLGALWHTVEFVHLGQQALQSAAVAQHLHHA